MLVHFSGVELTFSFLPFVVFIHCCNLILLQFLLSLVKMNKLVWRQTANWNNIPKTERSMSIFFFFSLNKSKTEEVTIKLCIYITPKETTPATKSFETPRILVECKSRRTFLQVVFDCFGSRSAAQTEFSRDDMQEKKKKVFKSTDPLIPLRVTSKPFWGEQS